MTRSRFNPALVSNLLDVGAAEAQPPRGTVPATAPPSSPPPPPGTLIDDPGTPGSIKASGILLPVKRRAGVVDRSGNDRRRMTFYLSPDTAKRVEMLAVDRNCELSEIGEAALTRLLDEIGRAG